MLSSRSPQRIFSPGSLWGPVSPVKTAQFHPSDSLCCLPQLWTDRVGARENPPLVSTVASEWVGVPPPGTERPLQPQRAGSLAPHLPGPSALRVSALPGKWRTRAGHLPASPGTLLSAQLRQIFPEPLSSPQCCRGEEDPCLPVGALRCGGDQVAFK